MFLYMIDRVAGVLASGDFTEIVKVSSLAVLAVRFAERTRDLRYKALHDSRYYHEYQDALTKFTRYSSMLLKLTGSPKVLETLLEPPKEVRFWKSKVFESAFEGLVRYYSVDFHGECPDNLVAGLEMVCSSVLRGEKTCLVTVEQVARHVASILPQCVYVPISLEV